MYFAITLSTRLRILRSTAFFLLKSIILGILVIIIVMLYVMYTCCGFILSLVQFLFSFVYGIVIYDNKFRTKENRI